MNPFIPDLWLVIIGAGVSLALFTLVGLIYPFISSKEKTAEETESPRSTNSIQETSPEELNVDEAKDFGVLLARTYLDLSREVARKTSIIIDPGDTEREILNKLVVDSIIPNDESLTRIHRLYEISRFSKKSISEEESKIAITEARELLRKMSQ